MKFKINLKNGQRRQNTEKNLKDFLISGFIKQTAHVPKCYLFIKTKNVLEELFEIKTSGQILVEQTDRLDSD